MRTETTKTTDKTEELLEQLHAGIEALTTTEAWTAWLDVAHRLPTYSLNNLILLWTQKPDATHVAGYRAWKALGRQVRKGEKGLRILAPCTYNTTDEDTGEERRVVRGFRPVAVFDISQTDGDPLPEAPLATLTGHVPRLFRHQLSCLIRAEGFAFRKGPMPAGHEGANGVTDWGTRTVTVRDDLTDAQTAKTTAHELAHVLLHGPACRLDRGTREVEAESVAYLVCATAGVDASGYSFGYVAGWAGGDLEAISTTAGVSHNDRGIWRFGGRRQLRRDGGLGRLRLGRRRRRRRAAVATRSSERERPEQQAAETNSGTIWRRTYHSNLADRIARDASRVGRADLGRG